MKLSPSINFYENVLVKLDDFKIEHIAKSLPRLPEIKQYAHVMKLGPGIHSPCIDEVLPELNKNAKFLKSNDGRRTRYHCNSILESQYIAKMIEEKLGDNGYEVLNYNKYFIEIKTSEYTSIPPIMSKIGLIPLYSTHNKHQESIIFAIPIDLKNYDLLGELDNRKKSLIKRGISFSFPTIIKKIESQVFLPDIQFYNPNFLELLITSKPKFTELQVKTLLSLYYMAEAKIPFYLIYKPHLIRILAHHTKMSSRTIEKHLEHNKLLEILLKIYSTSQFKSSIKQELQYVPEVFSDLNERMKSLEETTKMTNKKMKGEKNIPLCNSIQSFNIQTPVDHDKQIECNRSMTKEYHNKIYTLSTNTKKFERTFEEIMRSIIKNHKRSELDKSMIVRYIQNLKDSAEKYHLFYEDISNFFELIGDEKIDENLVKSKFENLMTKFEEWDDSQDEEFVPDLDQSQLSDLKKYYFDLESDMSNGTFSFFIESDEITCEICNSQTCNHVFEIVSNSKIRERIARREIVINPDFEKHILEKYEKQKAFTQSVESSSVTSEQKIE